MIKKNSKNKGISEKKTLSWSAEVSAAPVADIQMSFFRKKMSTPLSQDINKLWKRIRPAIKSNDWSALDQLLTSLKVDEKVMEKLFLEKGMEIFGAALFSEEEGYRSFILDKVPRACVQTVLRHNNFEILRDFLSAQVHFARWGRYTESLKALRVRELLFLLEVDYVGVSQFINASALDEGVYEECRLAAESLAEEGGSTEGLLPRNTVYSTEVQREPSC